MKLLEQNLKKERKQMHKEDMKLPVKSGWMSEVLDRYLHLKVLTYL